MIIRDKQGKFMKGSSKHLVKRIKLNCSNCDNILYRLLCNIKNRKNYFCNHGCKAEWQKEHLKGINNPYYNKKHSEEVIEKMKVIAKKRLSIPENNPMFGKVHPNKGKKFKEIYGEDKANRFIDMMSKRTKGETNPMWRGGISFEPYSLDFNERFRKKIKERDKYHCQVCTLFEEDAIKLYKKGLAVHHIDYNKQNSFLQNCISLCILCHGKTNANRESWKVFFQDLLKRKYGYEYTEDQKIILNFM